MPLLRLPPIPRLRPPSLNPAASSPQSDPWHPKVAVAKPARSRRQIAKARLVVALRQRAVAPSAVKPEAAQMPTVTAPHAEAASPKHAGREIAVITPARARAKSTRQ